MSKPKLHLGEADTYREKPVSGLQGRKTHSQKIQERIDLLRHQLHFIENGGKEQIVPSISHIQMELPEDPSILTLQQKLHEEPSCRESLISNIQAQIRFLADAKADVLRELRETAQKDIDQLSNMFDDNDELTSEINFEITKLEEKLTMMKPAPGAEADPEKNAAIAKIMIQIAELKITKLKHHPKADSNQQIRKEINRLQMDIIDIEVNVLEAELDELGKDPKAQENPTRIKRIAEIKSVINAKFAEKKTSFYDILDSASEELSSSRPPKEAPEKPKDEYEAIHLELYGKSEGRYHTFSPASLLEKLPKGYPLLRAIQVIFDHLGHLENAQRESLKELPESLDKMQRKLKNMQGALGRLKNRKVRLDEINSKIMKMLYGNEKGRILRDIETMLGWFKRELNLGDIKGFGVDAVKDSIDLVQDKVDRYGQPITVAEQSLKNLKEAFETYLNRYNELRDEYVAKYTKMTKEGGLWVNFQGEFFVDHEQTMKGFEQTWNDFPERA